MGQSKKYRYWTKEEIDFLKANYGNVAASEIADCLKRTVKSVEKKAAKLGLKSKVPDSKMYANPWNRGIRVRLAEKHHAWRKVGEAYEASGRMYIKPSRDSKPVLYARHLMKGAGYDIEGKCVYFKDRNPLNCELENLQIISRAELARINYDNCADPQMRSLRMRMARTGETIVDLILKAVI